jgi:hypothetical protein
MVNRPITKIFLYATQKRGELSFLIDCFFGEKITTTKITMSKTKNNIKKCVNHHYIKSVFLVHHYIEIDKDHNVESVFLVHQYYDKNQTFDVLIFKKDHNVKNHLWRITYGYQGLWGVR